MTQTLSARLLDQHGRFMRALETRRPPRPRDRVPAGRRGRSRERQAAGHGLTRPELAVLLAYAKISLYDELLPSDLPDDPQLADDLSRYFPTRLREQFRRAIGRHRLRREIIATVVTNSLVNRVGSPSSHEMKEKTGCRRRDIARAYVDHPRASSAARVCGADRGARQQGAGQRCRSRC